MHSILNSYLRIFRTVGFKIKTLTSIAAREKEKLVKPFENKCQKNTSDSFNTTSIFNHFNPIAIRNVRRYRFAWHTTENKFCKKI